MTGWQLHLLDHMQLICILLQTDNHASTSSLIFYKPDALPDAQATVSKALKAKSLNSNNKLCIIVVINAWFISIMKNTIVCLLFCMISYDTLNYTMRYTMPISAVRRQVC